MPTPNKPLVATPLSVSAHEQRLTEIEIKFMEQEQTLEILNRQLYAQQQEIQALKQTLDVFVARLKGMGIPAVVAEQDETPPPHY